MKTSLLVLSVLLGLHAVAALVPLTAIYYQVIGTGNFYLHRARIDTRTGNVTDLGTFDHAYASYETPGTWVRQSSTYAWVYPTQYLQSHIYTFGAAGVTNTNTNELRSIRSPAPNAGDWYYANSTIALANVNGEIWALAANDTYKTVWLTRINLATQQATAEIAVPALGGAQFQSPAYSVARNLLYVYQSSPAAVLVIDAATGGLQLTTSLDPDCARIENMWSIDDTSLLILARAQGDFNSPLSLRKLNPATGSCALVAQITTTTGYYTGDSDYDHIAQTVAVLVFTSTKEAQAEERAERVHARASAYAHGRRVLPVGATTTSGAPMFGDGNLIVADLTTQTTKNFPLTPRFQAYGFANIRFQN